jgi:hypothetical protein
MVRGVVSVSARKMELLKGELRVIKGALDQMQECFELLLDEFAQLQHEDFSAAHLAACIEAAPSLDEEDAEAVCEVITASHGHAGVPCVPEAVRATAWATAPAAPAEEEVSAIACAAPAVPVEEGVSTIVCAARAAPAGEEASAIACATPAEEEMSANPSAAPAAPAGHEVRAAASVATPTARAESEDAIEPECVHEVTEIAAAAVPEAEDTEWTIADADENVAVIPEIAATSPCAEDVPAQDIALRAPWAIAAETGSSVVSVAKTVAVTVPAAIASAPTSFEERRRSRELKRVRPDRLSRYAGVAAIVAMIVAMALVSSGVSGGFADLLPLGPTDTQPS